MPTLSYEDYTIDVQWTEIFSHSVIENPSSESPPINHQKYKRIGFINEIMYIGTIIIFIFSLFVMFIIHQIVRFGLEKKTSFVFWAVWLSLLLMYTISSIFCYYFDRYYKILRFKITEYREAEILRQIFDDVEDNTQSNSDLTTDSSYDN